MSEDINKDAGRRPVSSRHLSPGDPVAPLAVPEGDRRAARLPNLAGRPWVIVFGRRTQLSELGASLRPYLAAQMTKDLVVFLVSRTWEVGQQSPEDPSIRFVTDEDSALAAYFGIGSSDEPVALVSIVVDRNLRILDYISAVDPIEHASRIKVALIGQVATLSVPALPQAPVLLVPRIFEPEFCTTLIDYHRSGNARLTGFMRDIDGRTIEVIDPARKHRCDVQIIDENLKQAVRQRLLRRLVPEMQKAFQFEPTRIERYLIGAYGDGDRGHFRAHRDNTTRGTAHRQFAVSINLNDGFQGGDLTFPEYGGQTYRPPPGGALVFSCSLLHEVQPVERGRRLCFLPFLYDERGAELRAKYHRFAPSSPVSTS